MGAHHRITLDLAPDVYERLAGSVGKGKLEQFLQEHLGRMAADLHDRGKTGRSSQDALLAGGYSEMAADERRERDALEWAEATLSDAAGER